MNKVILVLVSFCFSYCIHAQCLSGNCKSGIGTYRFNNGAIYSGKFERGKAHGEGSLRFSNGNVYTGRWIYSIREGKGKMVFKSGDRYEGMFKKNKFHGHGVYFFKDGKKYDGDWVNGKAHGQGSLVELGGEEKAGLWEHGEYVGANNMEPENTKEYVEHQEIRDCNLIDCENGRGQYVYADGSVFIGEFHENRPQGVGEINYSNGDHYSGSWQNDQPHGSGKMIYADGSILEGFWKDGEFIYGQSGESTPDNESKIYALLVGVSRYYNFPTLKYTDDDAYRLYAFLKSPEGGALPDDQLRILIDESATKANIVSALEDIVARADENDALFCFFSGHGLDGFFLPINSDGYRNTLSYGEIKKLLDDSRAKQKLYVADACYSGSFLSARTPLTKSLELFYDRLNQSDGGTAFLLSSKKEEFSLESKGLRQGVFSHYLIKGLQGMADANTDKIVSIGELFQYVNQEVKSYTKNAQNPLIAGNFDRDMPLAMIRY